MKLSKKSTIGFVVIVAITILILGINFFKGNSLFTTENTYYALYDRVDGLKQSSVVTLKGLQIGQIKSIDFVNNGNNLLVTFSVNNKIQIPNSTIAKIVSADIMGTKKIKLITGNSKQYLQAEDTLVGQVERDLKEQVSMQMLPIKTKAEKLMSSIDSVLSVIQYVFNQETRDNLRQSIGSIDQTFLQLKNTSKTLNTIIDGQKQHLSNIITNVDSITYNLKNNNKNITHILNKFATISDSLNAKEISNTFKNIQLTVSNINTTLAKIEKGDGSLGKLLNNDSLYYNLSNASASLNNLLVDIKDNPKKYLHFSIFDTGKKVYMNTKKNKRTTYAIQILSSPNRIELNQPPFNKYKKIDIVFYNKTYRYLLLKDKSRKQIIKHFDKIKKDFPESFIIKVTEE